MSYGTLRDGLWIKKLPSYYTPSQVTQWLACIGFTPEIDESIVSSGQFSVTLQNLEILMRKHLLTFPFENTAMHYTPDHGMDVSSEGAFRRLVIDHKGSYCFGQNTVFLGMLRGLGYRSYPAAARVNEAHPDSESLSYTSLSHMVVLVQPFEDSNQTYLVDVGFGSTGLVRPILLSNAEDNVEIGVTPTEKHRLTRTSYPTSSLVTNRGSSIPGELKWNLEVWHQSKDASPNVGSQRWKILYSFSEEESFPRDHADASFLVAHRNRPDGLFCNYVICVKHFPLNGELRRKYGFDDDKDEDAYMYRMVLMGQNVKRYVGSHTEAVQTFSNELERIKALHEIFGINIGDDAAQYIQGRSAALPS